MSTGHAPPEPSQTAAVKAQRLLSCVQCHQRKTKCDRKFPCTTCIRAGTQCVHTLGPRPRRRRFPERELLDRLRHYETLLRENHINFEPLHPSPATTKVDDASLESSKQKTVVKSEVVDLWQAISEVTLYPDVDNEDSDGVSNANADADGIFMDDDEDVRRRDAVIEKAWTHRFQNHGNSRTYDRPGEYLLFGHPDMNIDFRAWHPGQAQIFKLWQIYLDNVNSLLKVTHIPTLQPRVLDAVSNLANISPSLQALIFSIYCLSILSLTQDECFALFQLSRKDLLSNYQFICRQALLNCNAWQSSDIDSLTALYFYLLSVASKIDPRSLSSMFAVLIRTLQRMGMHIESTNMKHTALKAEMSRRLWWSVVVFDHRICELCDDKTTSLTPVWDCQTPLNVNDIELRQEIKNSPAAHEKPTEALFAIVRSELADSIRHSAFHVNFANPSLNAITQPRVALDDTGPEGSALVATEKAMKDKYLAYCNPEDPLHFVTIWTTRASIARNRLLEHYSRRSTASARLMDEERRAAFCFALDMLECDTTLKSSPLAKRYLWFNDLYFPALAYVHLLNGLMKKPGESDADKAWHAMSDNYDALTPRRNQLSTDEHGGVHFLFVTFSRVILQAWDAREAFQKQRNEPNLAPPRLVSDIRSKVMEMTSISLSKNNVELPNKSIGSTSNTNNSSIAAFLMNQGDQNDISREQDFTDPRSEGFFLNTSEQPILDVNLDQFLPEVDWRWIDTQRY